MPKLQVRRISTRFLAALQSFQTFEPSSPQYLLIPFYSGCILCGCLPMLPKFIQNMGKSLSGLSTSNSSFVRIILSPWTLVRLSQDSDSHQTTKHTWNSGSTRRSLEPLKSPYKEIDDIELAEHGRYQAENTGHKQIFKHVDIQVSHQSGGLRLFESQREKEQPWASKQSAV